MSKVVGRANKNKEAFILERDGLPVAALVNIDDFEDFLDVQDIKLRNQIKKSYSEYLKGKSRPVEEFINEINNNSSKIKAGKKAD